jgi:hypothetical protein
MAKNKITEYSNTAASNTDVGAIDIQGGANVANFDDGLRTLMKHIADLNTGASFIHDTYKIADSDEETRLAKFDAGSITAGQTRTFTFPDKDGTFAMSGDVLALAGGTLTGFVTLHATPTADFHAATKKYVDDNSATTANPVFTGEAEFEEISDGSTAVDASYVVNGSAKARVNFNGTGTIAVRGSLNVSSIIDNGTGDYTINFTNDLSDGFYSATHMVAQANNDSAGASSVDWMIYYSQTTSALRVTSGNGSASSADMYYVALTIHGDLA